MKRNLLSIVAVAGVAYFFAATGYAQDASKDIKVTPLLKTSTSWDAKALVYPQGKAEVTGIIVEIAPGGETGWHLHPVPCFGFMLEGDLDISLKDGRVKRLHKGDVVAETVNTLHNGRNVGKVPVRILVFYTGIEGQVLTQKEPLKTSAVAVKRKANP